MPYTFAQELQQAVGFVGGAAHLAPLLAVREALNGQLWRFQWGDGPMPRGHHDVLGKMLGETEPKSLVQITKTQMTKLMKLVENSWVKICENLCPKVVDGSKATHLASDRQRCATPTAHRGKASVLSDISCHCTWHIQKETCWLRGFFQLWYCWLIPSGWKQQPNQECDKLKEAMSRDALKGGQQFTSRSWIRRSSVSKVSVLGTPTTTLKIYVGISIKLSSVCLGKLK